MTATFWPESLQQPLLRAAFLSGAAARAAWDRWRSLVDIEQYPDPGAFRLLPQVCRNVRALGVDDPLLDKLQGIARQTWFKNQRAFAALAPVVRAAGADVLVRGDAAMALRCPDYALDAEPAWSLLVRPEHAETVIRRLQASDWVPADPPPDALLPAYVAYRGTQAFRGGDGARLRLAWRWSLDHPDDGVWSRARPVAVHDVTVALLGPADHVVDVSAEAARPLFWRAVDVMLIACAADGDLDWARVVAAARERGLAPRVAETVRYVQDALDAPLPDDVVAALHAGSATAACDLAPPSTTIAREVSRLWSSYRACSGPLGFGRRLLYFPKYLQYAWHLDRLSQVPRRAWVSTRYVLR
jgi:hypothetical protein